MKIPCLSYVCQQNYNYLFKESKIYANIFCRFNSILLISDLKETVFLILNYPLTFD